MIMRKGVIATHGSLSRCTYFPFKYVDQLNNVYIWRNTIQAWQFGLEGRVCVDPVDPITYTSSTQTRTDY
jgi:hypothetical protein